jgi:hypothetical protein
MCQSVPLPHGLSKLYARQTCRCPVAPRRRRLTLAWRGKAWRGGARPGGARQGMAGLAKRLRWQHRGLSLVWRPRRNELMPSLKALDRPRAHDAAQDAMTAKPLRPAASSKARPRPSSRHPRGLLRHYGPSRAEKFEGRKVCEGVRGLGESVQYVFDPGAPSRPLGARSPFASLGVRALGDVDARGGRGLLGRTSEGPLQGAER